MHVWHHAALKPLLRNSSRTHIELEVLLNLGNVVLDILVVVEVLRWIAILWVHHLLLA